jgi:hypothetical protein
MKPKLTVVIVWVLIVWFCGMILLTLVLDFARHASISDSVIYTSQALVFTIPAAMIILQQPRNTIGWLLMFPAGVFAVGGVADNYLQGVEAARATLPLLLLVWFSSWSWLLYIFPLLLIALLFPNGRPPTKGWNWVQAAVILWIALFILIASFAKVFQPDVGPEIPNPLGFFSKEFVLQFIGPWQIGLVALTALSVISLFVRYRRGSAVEQEQIKWLVYTCGVFGLVYITGGFVLGLGDTATLASDVFNILLALTTACIPIAIAIAVLRYRLWDIDIIIRRTLQYALLTGALALVYFGSVVVLQKIFSGILPEANASFVIVLTTLAIAALFNPLRQRLQNFIDRRFFRAKYNAEQAITRFATTARDEVDMERLESELLELVETTMQPERMNLWLRVTKEQ